eukprot:11878-Heterococcus_DN1.PRE.1
MPQTTVSLRQLSLEKPPGIERPLYLICYDSIIKEADPTGSLFKALEYQGLSRLTAARTLSAKTQWLQHVPVAARERFCELVNATPTTAGTSCCHRYTQDINKLLKQHYGMNSVIHYKQQAN